MESPKGAEEPVKNILKKDERQWIYFTRQFLVASGAWNIYFTIGLFIGAPTVFIPQMRKEANSTTFISQEMASWLSSLPTYSAIPWVFILPNLAQHIGRKKTSIIMAFGSIIAYIIFICSSSPTHLIISDFFIGIPHGSILTVSIIVIAEYTSPKFRGSFLTIKSASLVWGIWVSNTIGTYTNWTYIPIVGLVCSIYSLSVFFWPESPQWLASKGRFNECRTNHRWLKGTDDESEKELENIIKNEGCVEKVSYSKKELTSKKFLMPLALSFVAVCQYHLSGKIVFSVYAIDMIKKIVEDSSVYKTMLILDGVTVFSTYIGCFLSKILKRRTLLLSSCASAISFLYVTSLYLYLMDLGVMTDNIYLSLFLMGGFSFSISIGPIIMSTTLFGELISSQFKSLSIFLVALSFSFLQGTTLKIAPLIFENLGMHGTFLFYGICSNILVIIMYFYLPETKDMTLVEIEKYFKDKSRVEEVRQLVKTDVIAK